MKKSIVLLLLTIALSGYSQTCNNTITLLGTAATSTFKNASINDRLPATADTNQLEIPVIAWTCNVYGVPLCNTRSVAWYDLSSVPSYATVLSAKLYLYPTTGNINGQTGNPMFNQPPNPDLNTVLVQKVISPWDLATVTWDNPPVVTTTAQKIIPPTDDDVTPVQIDLPDFVQDWVANPSTNYGLFFRLETEVHYNSMVFYSGTADDAHKPRLEITYTLSRGPVNLGPDKDICPGNTMLLNAGKGYLSYLWQDGSTDSTFTVTTPGTYFVEAHDACGGIYHDTVVVNPHLPIPIDIGPDRIKCNNDTIHIDAPPGFLNYLWGPIYNINSSSAQDVVVSPAVDTNYYVRAEQTPGCFAYDTIRIAVYSAPVINLGPDTKFCRGDSVVLDAGNVFNQYQWSTGAATQHISVFNEGSYSVTATTSQGCKSYDTLNVTTVFPLPVVALNHDSTLCTGDSRSLDAGNGFVSYEWDNGSNQQIISVTMPGTYSVMVTDINGCKAGDTATITALNPLPAAFMPGDSSICSYGTLLLQPLRSFNNYLWNNGATSPTITISQPGLYWLQVQDNKNCIGRDSIQVSPKQCLEGFYIPGAFTPNGDGKNDNYKPDVLGNILQYRFTIYNRWGQAIFQTTDINKGWDGTYTGRLQDTNVFVWTCTYQFAGEKIQAKKGTFILIR